LKGEVALDFMIAPPAPAGDPLQPRQRLFQVLDQTLLALHQDNVRQGRAFLLTDEDLGFELDGFRLTQVGPLPDRPDNVRSLRTIYQYAGRFWPVEVPAEGGIIQHLPTRLVILPVQIPEGLTAQAGGADVTIPLPVDLRAFNGAPVRLVARLRGASPPGTLRGDSADVPAGFVAYAPDDAGVFQVVYRPPATLSNDTQVRVSLGLAHADRPTVQLGELKLQVRR
jgi:hypothetical protein